MTYEEQPTPGGDKSNKTSFEISGDKLVETVKNLLHQGNVRKVIIQQDGRTLLEIPLTVAVVGTALGLWFAPILAALGAIGALVAKVTIIVERGGGNDDDTNNPSQTM